jgi:glutathione S-transferase
MTSPAVTLHQFRYSHFNEKVRWALGYKGIAHERVSELPGPHRRAMHALSGQNSTPVLAIDGTVFAGSAAIIDALEQRWPTPALYPAGPADRAHALEIQQRFDKVVGPSARTALYAELLDERWFLSGLFSEGQPPARRLLYRLAFPLVARLIRKGYRVNDPVAVSRSVEETEKALDFVAATAGPSGHLVGDAFSVADLTCAALLAPLVNPAHVDMHWPEPHPDRVHRHIERWRAHPGATWVLACYERYRPARA